MGLIEELSVSVTPEQEAAIQAIDDLDLGEAKEALVRSGEVDEDDVDAVEQEFKRFFTMKVLYRGTEHEGSFGPSKPIDDLWHNFILETERYMPFCEQNLGFQVHHRPYTPARSRSETIELLEDTWTTFDEHTWEGPLRDCIAPVVDQS
jgi:hypothetical protein